MKLESLVIVDQHATVNTFTVLYTLPVKPWESTLSEIGALTARRQPLMVELVTGVKS